MKLINFDLSEPSFAIELVGLNFVWDLHNAGTFLGIVLNASENSATLKWKIDGHPAAKYVGCDLVFRGLKLIIISPRAAELPLSEDSCISGISKVVPSEEMDYKDRVRKQWGINDPFRLLFAFQSGRSIEIDSETVELIGITSNLTFNGGAN